MKRNEFFAALGVSAGTILLAPFLVSCSKSSMNGVTPVPPGGGTIDFTLDLTQPGNAALNSNGGSLVKNGVIVARTSNGDFVAVASACTHQGYTIEYDNANTRFHCPNPAPGHGSNYSTTGSVINGPAVTALQKFTTTLTGTSLRVFA